MIFDAARIDVIDAEVAGDPGLVGVKIGTNFAMEESMPIPGREDDVDVDGGVCVHGSSEPCGCPRGNRTSAARFVAAAFAAAHSAA
jgi:hypothetical protein